MTEINDNLNQNETSLPIGLNDKVYFEELKDRQDEASNKNMKNNIGLTRTTIVKKNIEDYSLDNLGTIENAKKHRSANRPLHQLTEFTECVNFCRCCNLPCEEKGIIEPFNFCDDIDLFSECGLGITLYFHFFRFMALIVFMGIGVLAISMIVLNHKYTDDIIDICKKYYKDNNGTLGYCEGYIKNSNDNTNLYEKFNRWLVRLSSHNIQVYRNLPADNNWRNKDDVNDVVVNYSTLNFFYLITAFILNICFIIFIKAKAQDVRLLNFSIRDYTVLISHAKNILKYYVANQTQINEFKNFVNDYIIPDKELKDIKINIINLCYDLGQYMEFRDDYEVCKRKIFQIENNPYNIELNKKKGLFGDNRRYYDFLLYKLNIRICHCLYDIGNNNIQDLYALKKKKEELERQLEQEQQNAQIVNQNNFTGYMFVSFDTIKDKELFLRQYPHNFFGMIFYFLKNIKYYLFCCCMSKEATTRFRKAKGIDAYDPPEPDDVIWENFKYTESKRRNRVICVFFFCIIIMIISIGIVFGLTFVQDILYQNDKEQGNTNIFLKYLISFAIILVISIINAIFQVFFEHITHYEKQISRSNEILSTSIKISFFTFLNSAIIPLISKHLVLKIKDKRYYKSDFLRRERNNLLIDDMFVFFIVNAIITPLLWCFNFFYTVNRIQQFCIERGKDPDKNHYMTQRDLNELYLYPDMDLAYKYSYLIKTTAMCLFLMPIFPLGFIIAFVGFVFAYFLEKFNFTHLYRRPQMLDEIITKFYADYFIVLLFIGGIGDYIFLHDVYDTKAWALLNIILFGVLIIVPYSKFFDWNFVGIDKSEFQNRSLSNVYFTFYNDYQRQNPLTKKFGFLNYLSELKQYNYLSDKAYQIAEENIDQLNVMEIYYGVSKRIAPVEQQTILDKSEKKSILANSNITKSILGRGFLNSTIVKPEIEDDPEIKRQKRQFFESQIMNMFGKNMVNRELKGDLGNTEVINELDEIEITKSIYKDEKKD